MSGRYTLAPDGRTPIREPDLLKWAQWFETADRHVAEDTCREVRVSTVFLGLNHRLIGSGPPILWETLIVGGERDGDMERYTSYEDAVEGHARYVQLACSNWRAKL